MERFIRKSFDIIGTVQGVGFRPTVYRLAKELGLGGSVQNRHGTVRLILEGPAELIDRFVKELRAALPPQARIEQWLAVGSSLLPAGHLNDFVILESAETSTAAAAAAEKPRVSFPPDLAMCPGCAADISDSANRRYRYPFTTCTNCGPRYTVINGMPYDRERTTLAAFPLCPACLHEYRDPGSRRFHAESIACPACGPALRLLEQAGAVWTGGDAVRETRRRLAAGQICALRGLGGFLLALDARNKSALAELRVRKQRPHKPLALMARSLELIARYFVLPEAAEILLKSAAAPICILETRAAALEALPLDLISPDTGNAGLMLPYSPLHWLLFNGAADDDTPDFDFLVMTSGNRRAEPICISNEEALERLRGIADFFLIHDREINLRADDSVCVLQRPRGEASARPQIWRRARGFAPDPILLKNALARPVLATGAELKNTIALGYDREVRLSPHIGDLETPEALDGFYQALTNFPHFLSRGPAVVAVDLHPDMQAARIGKKIAAGLGIPAVGVQHHHAHAVGCLAEHGFSSGLALTFDGTGYGTDENIWGAELLQIQGPQDYKRLATFKAVPLPGGDTAVRKPARQLAGRWLQSGRKISPEQRRGLGLSEEELSVIELQVQRGINCPLTHAAGRVFDACSAALGFSPAALTYEGQAAVRLETAACAAAGRGPEKVLPFTVIEEKGLLMIDWSQTFEILSDRSAAFSRDAGLALSFHQAMAEAALKMVHYGLQCFNTNVVALSGGVFMNTLLCRLLVPALEALDVRVLLHSAVPPNDGGLSFGQVCVAGS